MLEFIRISAMTHTGETVDDVKIAAQLRKRFLPRWGTRQAYRIIALVLAAAEQSRFIERIDEYRVRYRRPETTALPQSPSITTSQRPAARPPQASADPTPAAKTPPPPLQRRGRQQHDNWSALQSSFRNGSLSLDEKWQALLKVVSDSDPESHSDRYS